MRTPGRYVVFASAAALLASCAARPPQADRPAPDFAVAVTVLAPGRSQAPVIRPAWYMLEADGQLRAATGQRRIGSPPPPIVRQLSPDEVAALWALFRDEGFTSGAGGGRAEMPDLGGREPAAPEAIVYTASAGTRRVRRLDLGDPDDRARAQRLLTRLDGLVRGRAGD